ncbi:hypothetical protein [uncultured Hymenobacter sp.]|uniref:hypothetical protein n=1 Tax=uncultured Hymenobacter sp. TaxID=170016 RepID=UPI0035CC0DAB
MKSLSKILLKSSFFFFLLFLTWYLFLFSGHLTLSDLVKKVAAPSILTSLCLTVAHFALAKQKGVKSNYSAYQIAEFNILGSEVYLPKIAEIANRDKKWKLVDSTSDKVVLRSPFNSAYSFGEILTLVRSGNILRVTSSPLLPTTLFDFGKGHENIKYINSIVKNYIL